MMHLEVLVLWCLWRLLGQVVGGWGLVLGLRQLGHWVMLEAFGSFFGGLLAFFFVFGGFGSFGRS